MSKYQNESISVERINEGSVWILTVRRKKIYRVDMSAGDGIARELG